jgi:hypothetical protein
VRKIAGFSSQVLVTGLYADDKRVFLSQPLIQGNDVDYLIGSRVGLLQTQTKEFNLSEASDMAAIQDFLDAGIYFNNERVMQLGGESSNSLLAIHNPDSQQYILFTTADAVPVNTPLL